MLKALCVAPALSFIAASVLLKSSALSPSSTIAAFPASLLLHRSLKLLLFSSAYCFSIARISDSEFPSALSCENDFPVFSLRIRSTDVPPFPNSLSIELRYVVLSAVAIPLAVISAYAAHSWSICTLFAFAVGITLPIALASSLTVVLPRFCVVMSISLICSVSLASRPYAFKDVVSMSVAAAVSVKPAFASLLALATKVTASAVFTPPDMALYTDSAISFADCPVSSDSLSMAELISSIDITLESAIVDTLAIASSKLDALAITAVPTAAAVALTGLSFSPTPVIFSPAFLKPSATLSSF